MARSRLSRARTSLDFHPGDRSVFFPLLFRSAFCRALPQDRYAGSEMSERNFFAELKRRNVYKVAIAYAVVGWLVILVSSTILPTFHAPECVVQSLIVIVELALPISR